MLVVSLMFLEIVILTLILFECGSVQMKLALISLTLFNPLILLRQIDNSYLLSLSALTHGGLKYLAQNLQ